MKQTHETVSQMFRTDRPVCLGRGTNVEHEDLHLALDLQGHSCKGHPLMVSPTAH